MWYNIQSVDLGIEPRLSQWPFSTACTMCVLLLNLRDKLIFLLCFFVFFSVVNHSFDKFAVSALVYFFDSSDDPVRWMNVLLCGLLIINMWHFLFCFCLLIVACSTNVCLFVWITCYLYVNPTCCAEIFVFYTKQHEHNFFTWLFTFFSLLFSF